MATPARSFRAFARIIALSSILLPADAPPLDGPHDGSLEQHDARPSDAQACELPTQFTPALKECRFVSACPPTARFAAHYLYAAASARSVHRAARAQPMHNTSKLKCVSHFFSILRDRTSSFLKQRSIAWFTAMQ